MAQCRDKCLWGYVQLFRQALIGCLAFLCACGQTPTRHDAQTRPNRIVSLDYCADQFVLKLANRADIAALSVDATRSFSYLREQATGLPRVRASAEDVLALKPDLIVRSYGGGPQAAAFFARAGIKVHQIGWGDDFDAVRSNVMDAATALGQGARGQDVVAAFDQRLANMPKAKGQAALYLTPSGVTSGRGSMIDKMIVAAGLSNFQQKAGWHPIDLESLLLRQPDMIARAHFGAHTDSLDQWSVMRHPQVRRLTQDLPVANFDGATTSCGGWFVLDAVSAMAHVGKNLP